MNVYTNEILEHFRNPQNMGEMEKPDAVGESGNSKDGDMVKIFLKIKNNEIIDIKAQVFGCVHAIAITSVTTQLVKGKNIEFVEKITKQDVANLLGGLSDQKMNCSNLALEGVSDAIHKYRK